MFLLTGLKLNNFTSHANTSSIVIYCLINSFLATSYWSLQYRQCFGTISIVNYVSLNIITSSSMSSHTTDYHHVNRFIEYQPPHLAIVNYRDWLHRILVISHYHRFPIIINIDVIIIFTSLVNTADYAGRHAGHRLATSRHTFNAFCHHYHHRQCRSLLRRSIPICFAIRPLVINTIPRHRHQCHAYARSPSNEWEWSPNRPTVLNVWDEQQQGQL